MRDILSAAIRDANKKLIAEVGDHERNWKNRGNEAVDSYVDVPIRANDQPWGSVEVRFRPLSRGGWIGMLQTPAWKLISFVAAISFLVFWAYLRKMLQHLDPSKVVPGRVRSALDTLTEGLLVLDVNDRVMLANSAFASLVGKVPDALIGQQVATFDWLDAVNDAPPRSVSLDRRIRAQRANAQCHAPPARHRRANPFFRRELLARARP